MPDSEVILLKGDDQRKIGGSVPNGHQGGAIHFGKDGKLYVGIGDQTTGLPAQKLDTFQGKLLRINAGRLDPRRQSVLQDCKGQVSGHLGLRAAKPVRFCGAAGHRPHSDQRRGRGPLGGDQRGRGRARTTVGRTPRGRAPTAVQGAAVRLRPQPGPVDHGRHVLQPADVQFPKEYVGKYFFADFMDNWIRVLDPDHPTDVRPFAAGLAGPVDVQVGPDGSLYVLESQRLGERRQVQAQHRLAAPHQLRRQQRKTGPAHHSPAGGRDGRASDRKATFRVAAKGQAPLRFQWYRNGRPVAGANGPTLTIKVTPADDGAEFRCVVSNAHGSGEEPRRPRCGRRRSPSCSTRSASARIRADLPRLLSETGIFQSLKDLTPAAGVLPYDVNSPLWSDGAVKRRWLVLPKDSQIGFSATRGVEIPSRHRVGQAL